MLETRLRPEGARWPVHRRCVHTSQNSSSRKHATVHAAAHARAAPWFTTRSGECRCATYAITGIRRLVLMLSAWWCIVKQSEESSRTTFDALVPASPAKPVRPGTSASPRHEAQISLHFAMTRHSTVQSLRAPPSCNRGPVRVTSRTSQLTLLARREHSEGKDTVLCRWLGLQAPLPTP